MARKIDKKVLQVLASVRLLILDVDGVLTNGQLYYTGEGEVLRSFFVGDGLGIRLLMEAGVEVAIISGRNSPLVAARCRDLKINYLYQGALNKKIVFEELLAQLNLESKQVAFMGDDIIDIPILQKVGFAAAPQNPHPDIVSYLHWQSEYKGGEGAVRELTDLILKAQQQLEPIYQRLRTQGNIYKDTESSC
jgi:3-deoxy-D-manno-octulosonate 8-phosphate phosphatase (KDO 8-P phosphatase)